MTLKVGDRVYVDFLKGYGHIQKIQQREPIAALKETEPKTVYRVKREGRDTLAAGFRKEALKLVPDLTDIEIYNILEEEKYEPDYQSESHYFQVASVCWGKGIMAGEIFLQYDLMKETSLGENYSYSGVSYCIRNAVKPCYDICPQRSEKIESELSGSTYCIHKKTNDKYFLDDICYGLDTMKNKIIAMYSKCIELTNGNSSTLCFCRELEDFKSKFEWR